MNNRVKAFIIFMGFIGSLNAETTTIREFLINNAQEVVKVEYKQGSVEAIKESKYADLSLRIASCMHFTRRIEEETAFKMCYYEAIIRAHRALSSVDLQDVQWAQNRFDELERLGEEVKKEKNMNLDLNLSDLKKN